MSTEALDKQIKQLELEKYRAALKERIEKIDHDFKAVTDALLKKNHDEKLRPLLQLHEAQRYLDEQIAEITAAGTVAKNSAGDTSGVAVEIAADGKSLRSVAPLRVGGAVNIKNGVYFLTGTDDCPLLPTYDIAKTNATCSIKYVQESSTPYSQLETTPAIFDYISHTLTLQKHYAIQTGQIIVISGIRYEPAATFLTSIGPDFLSYELRILEDH